MTLLGKILITGEIESLTGLHIGGSSTGMEIGGVDLIVIRDSVTKRPYVPGSSLKGKMRYLLETSQGKDPNKKVGNSMIHMCDSLNEYMKCDVCRVFGVTPDSLKTDETPADKTGTGSVGPLLTRLIVRDALMTEETAKNLERSDTDLLYTDVKTEVVIDRLTSQATPRQIERVPAGSRFEFEMVFNVFVNGDKELLKRVFQSMALLEDDYLGGQGSRGYGRVKFDINDIRWRPRDYYLNGTGEVTGLNKGKRSVSEIWKELDEILKGISTAGQPAGS
ncbi:MAG TPA: type III-A CRISPR-associated RAMP protein Csm3 [Methanothrix sp.]|nr:type III-A CRISPR-associated RAMP protein Csm3 [Methanothrix sp.]HOL44646.1 type III-A CRISPR-associated RAMP protein Csm3 [Methanothrix sp.]